MVDDFVVRAAVSERPHLHEGVLVDGRLGRCRRGAPARGAYRVVVVDHHLDVRGQAGLVEPEDEAPGVAFIDAALGEAEAKAVGREVGLVWQEPHGLEDLDDEAGAVESPDRVVTVPDVGQAKERPGILRRLRAEVVGLQMVGGHADKKPLKALLGPGGEQLPEVVVVGHLAKDHEDIEGERQDLEWMHRRDEQEVDPRAGDADEGREDGRADALELQGFLDDLSDEACDSAAGERQDSGHDVGIDLDRNCGAFVLAQDPRHRRELRRPREGRKKKDDDRDCGQKTEETLFHDNLQNCACLTNSA